MAASSCPCPSCGCSTNNLLSSSLSPPSPRVAELLASNEPPSDTERVAISDENEQLMRQIAELNTCISRTEASLERLRAGKDALRAQLTARTHILNPIRTLPTDILYEIFARCIDRDESTSKEKVPWILATVSRRWRTTAIAFSQMWSHITINLDDLSVAFERRRYDRCYNRLSLRMQRARQYPLSLHLISESQSLEGFPDIVRVLSETSHCWKQLILHGRLPLFNSLLARELPLPLLQAVDMDVDMGVGVNTSSSSVFRNASSLAHLTVPVDVLLQFKWPVSQIIACTVSPAYSAIPNSRACGVIRRFSRLQVLSYSMETWSIDEPRESPITLLSLTKLTLDLSSLSSGDQLLEALVLPKLTHLWLKGTLNSNTVPWILSLHARSNFNLFSLTFDPNVEDIKPEIVFNFLKAFPRISELYFCSRCRYLGKILMRLAEETTMAPNLKVLSLNEVRVTSSAKYLPVLASSRPDLYVQYHLY